MEESHLPKIALIGGGTGSFTLLQELKHLTPDISALVNMSDDGGSSGILRDEYGILPPGDIRQCLVALSEVPEMREVFSYRFGEGSFEGHSLGNIILAGLERQYGRFDQAVKVASSILRITGQVIPITLDQHTLVMHDNGQAIRGEFVIGHRPIEKPGAVLELDPPANLNPEAGIAIKQADMVVIAPGNLYGSLLPALATTGLKPALAESNAKTIVVSNLVTKPGQTDGWHVIDYVKEFERYIGSGRVDFVLYNNQAPSKDLLAKYAADGEYPVAIDESAFSQIGAKAIGADLIGQITHKDNNDKAVPRTLIRHNAAKVGRQLMKIFYD